MALMIILIKDKITYNAIYTHTYQLSGTRHFTKLLSLIVAPPEFQEYIEYVEVLRL